MKNKHYTIFCILLLGSFCSKSQYNFTSITNSHFANTGSYLLPSLLGNHTKVGEFYFAAPFVGYATNFVSFKDIQQISNSESLSNEYMGSFLRELKQKNKLWLGYDAPLFNVFFNIPKQRKPFLSFALGARSKTDLHIESNPELLRFALQGNKQYAGDWVTLSSSINMLSYNELYVAASGIVPFVLDSSLMLKIKPAIRIRKLWSMAALQMSNASAQVYTAADGSYMDVTTSMLLNMATSVDTPSLSGKFGVGTRLGNSGKGMGVDLGISVSMKENSMLHAGLVDIGSIRFSKNTINYISDATVRYDGFNANQLSSLQDSSFNLESTEELLSPRTTYDEFTVPLGTKLVLNAWYGIGAKKRRRIPYYAHNLYATYIQGFRNLSGSTTIPMLHIGYGYNYKNIVNLGSGVQIGGFSGISIGANASLKANWFKLGLGTNNVISWVTTKSSRTSDVVLLFGVSF